MREGVIDQTSVYYTVWMNWSLKGYFRVTKSPQASTSTTVLPVESQLGGLQENLPYVHVYPALVYVCVHACMSSQHVSQFEQILMDTKLFG